MGARYDIAQKILAGLASQPQDPSSELEGQTINTLPPPSGAWVQPTIEPPPALIMRPGWGDPAPGPATPVNIPSWVAGPQGGPEEPPWPAGMATLLTGGMREQEAKQAQAAAPINAQMAAGPASSAPLRALAALPGVAQGTPPLQGTEPPAMQPFGDQPGQPGAPGAQPAGGASRSISASGPAMPGQLGESIETLGDIAKKQQAAAEAAPGDIAAAFAKESAAAKMASEVAIDRAAEEAQQRRAAEGLLQAEEARQAAFNEKFHADYKAGMDRFQGAVDKYARAEVDPNRVWKSIGAGGQLGLAFSALLSSAGQALTSYRGGQAGPNMALAVFDKIIERDLHAQQLQIQQQGQAVGFEGNMLSQLQAQFGNEQQAFAAAKGILIARMQRGLGAIGDKYAGPEMDAKLAAVNAGLEQRRLAATNEYQKGLLEQAKGAAFSAGSLAAQKTQLSIASRDQALREREQALRERQAVEAASQGPAPIYSVDATGQPVEAWQPTRQVDDKERKEAAAFAQQHKSLDDDLSGILNTAQQAGLTDYSGLGTSARHNLDRLWAGARAKLLALRGFKRISPATMELAGKMLGENPSNFFSHTQEMVPLIRKQFRGELNAGMANLGYVNPVQATPKGNAPTE